MSKHSEVMAAGRWLHNRLAELSEQPVRKHSGCVLAEWKRARSTETCLLNGNVLAQWIRARSNTQVRPRGAE